MNLTKKDFNKLFINDFYNKKDIRDNFIIYSIYYLQIYPKDLIKLKIQDFYNFELNNKIIYFFNNYLKTRKSKQLTDFLITSIKKDEQPITIRAIEYIITKRAKEVGIQYKVTANSLINFTIDQKNIKRKNSSLQWHNTIKEKDNNKCIICGSNKNIIIHHIMSAADYPDLVNDINNGVCLCNNCHKKYHNFDNRGSVRTFIQFLLQNKYRNI